MREIRNARITNTQLGTEDHGIFTAWINVEYDGGGQGFGGFALDEPMKDEVGKFLGRVGTAYGMNFVKGIMEAVGAESWEKLPKMHCRVDGDSQRIYRIGHIIKDKWFNPEECK
jgi:hypothetical protein